MWCTPRNTFRPIVVHTVYTLSPNLSQTFQSCPFNADYTLLLYDHEDVHIITRALDEDLKGTSKWFDANKYHQNVNKTKRSLLGTRQRIRLNVIPNIQMDGNNIEHVDKYNYWRVYVDVI